MRDRGVGGVGAVVKVEIVMWERWCAGKAGEEEKVRAGDMFIRPASPAHSPMLCIDPRRPPRVKKGGTRERGRQVEWR